jgi:hypothetical protein
MATLQDGSGGAAGPGPPVDPPPAEPSRTAIEDQIRLLRDQVDALQVAAAEKRRPWYVQFSIILSLAAFLVSTASTVRSVVRENASDQSAVRQEVRGLIVDMIEIDGASGDDYRGEQKIEVLLSALAKLENRVKGGLSSQEYVVVADMEALYGDITNAESRYLAAVQAAASEREKALIYARLAGNLLILDGDRRKAHQYSDLAIGFLRGAAADSDSFYLVNALLDSAEAFHLDGDEASKNGRLLEALDVYERLTDPDWTARAAAEIEKRLPEIEVTEPLAALVADRSILH